MRQFVFKSGLIIFLFLIFSGCTVLKKRNSTPFVFSDAFYYSWFAGENEYGTNVQVTLKNVEHEVTFDSLIFRNLKVPVNASKNTEGTVLESALPGEGGRLKIEAERVEKSNRIIFSHKGTRQVYLLGDIRREEMRYY
jgi:hypothetical protein